MQHETRQNKIRTFQDLKGILCSEGKGLLTSLGFESTHVFESPLSLFSQPITISGEGNVGSFRLKSAINIAAWQSVPHVSSVRVQEE